MCNATIALEIAARALDLKGEVLLPSFTFIATAHALQWQGITPVFVDIDPRTHNIDPAAIERHITPRTTGIIGVHLWGRPCDTASLEAVAARHNLPVFYDAAHAFACSHEGRMIGGFGACEVFSFHATKFLNSFEGGAVVTNDADLAHRMKLMRNFGFVDYDRVDYVGTNGKMNEICAAMALVSLDALPDFIAINRRNYEAYGRGLDGLPGLSCVSLRFRPAKQLPVRRGGSGPGRGPVKAGRADRGAAGGKRAGAAILLARMSPDGALPFSPAGSRRSSTGNRTDCQSGARTAHRPGGHSGHDRHDLRHLRDRVRPGRSRSARGSPTGRVRQLLPTYIPRPKRPLGSYVTLSPAFRKAS